MKKFKLLISIFICLFFISSCTKTGKNITLKGKVVNPITGEPISGQKIVLYKGEISLEWSSGWKIIKETYSDKNGDFEISALRIGEILARKDGSPNDGTTYYPLGWDYNGSYHQAFKLNKGRKMYADYHLVPYGTLRMHVRNENCQGETDTLNIFFDGSDVLNLTGIEDANNHIGNILYAPITGCWDKTDNGFSTQSGRRFYHWTVKRGNNIETFYDTVYVQPNQTTTLNVFY